MDEYAATLPFRAVKRILTVPEPGASLLLGTGILSLCDLTGLRRRPLSRIEESGR